MTTPGPAVRTSTTPPRREPRTLIRCTGENARSEMMSHVVNDFAAPFLNVPPAREGGLGDVIKGIGGVLALLNAPLELATTGLAMATADFGASKPALPAAVIGLAIHMGVPHAHIHPPSCILPAPPIPLPSIGSIMLAGAQNVWINGIPAARVGDIGVVLTCGSLAPPSEIIMGSSSVLIGGSRAARILDITRHDNPIDPNAIAGPMNALGQAMETVGNVLEKTGKVLSGASILMSLGEAAGSSVTALTELDSAKADAAAAAAEGHALAAMMQAAQMAADAAGSALKAMVGKDPGLAPGLGVLMVGAANVHIGGFPCPDLKALAVGLLKLLKFRNRRVQGVLDGLLGRGCRNCS